MKVLHTPGLSARSSKQSSSGYSSTAVESYKRCSGYSGSSDCKLLFIIYSSYLICAWGYCSVIRVAMLCYQRLLVIVHEYSVRACCYLLLYHMNSVIPNRSALLPNEY